MNLKSITTALLASAAIVAGSAVQAGYVEDVVKDLIARGYTSVEVTNGTKTFKVEATKDGVRYEASFDTATGEALADGSGEDDGSSDAGDGSGDISDGSGDADGADGSSGGSGGDGGSGGGSSGGDSGGGSGSGGGRDAAFLLEQNIDYLTGGQGGDIDFV